MIDLIHFEMLLALREHAPTDERDDEDECAPQPDPWWDFWHRLAARADRSPFDARSRGRGGH